MLNIWKIIKKTSMESLEKDFKTLNHRFDFGWEKVMSMI
jgi:hypothetical protein